MRDVFNGLRQPSLSFVSILFHSASKCVHDPDHVHRLSVAGLGQAPETVRGFPVPMQGLWRLRPSLLRVKAAKAILRKGITLFG